MPRALSHFGATSGILKLCLQGSSLESRPRSGSMALLLLLLFLFLPCEATCTRRCVRDTLSAGNTRPCSISMPLPLREADAARPWVGVRTDLSSRTGQTSHAVCRAPWRFAATEKACVLVLWRGLPFSRQTAPEGLWVGRCLSKHSLSHHQLCLAVRVFLQYGELTPWLPSPPPPKKEHSTAKEAGCERSCNGCYEKWHSSHKQPLKMLHEPHAGALPAPP